MISTIKTAKRVYCTSYCNFGHCLDTGRPVNHECRIIPPEALEAERQGDTGKAIAILAASIAYPNR